MLDKTVPNFHVIMKRRAGLPIAMHVLPSGFSIVFWLNLFVMGLTNCTVIVMFGWGVKGANSGFCPRRVLVEAMGFRRTPNANLSPWG